MKYGCIDALLRQGVQRSDIVELEVPGAVELPFAAKSLILKASPSTGNIDAVVALGCLIKGETMHLSDQHSHYTPHTAARHRVGARVTQHPQSIADSALRLCAACAVAAVSTSAPPCLLA